MMKHPFKQQPAELLFLVLFLLVLGNGVTAFGQDRPEKQPNRQAPEMTAPPPATSSVEGAVTLLPEIALTVEMSSSDVNRITCQEEIKDVVFSKEKGIAVRFSGKDAFVKFRTTQKDGKTVYSATPSEIFIICGDSVYTMIAMPRRIPARSVRLSTGKMDNIRKNKSLLGSLPFEKKILSAIRSLYLEEIPESFTVSTPKQRIDLFRDLEFILYRVAVVDGEGFQVKEYRGTLTGSGKEQLELGEKDFLRKDISAQPLAVSLDRLVLRKGDTLRVFVAEIHYEESTHDR
jgi:conjugal transfer pilus assembly protein TraK